MSFVRKIADDAIPACLQVYRLCMTVLSQLLVFQFFHVNITSVTCIGSTFMTKLSHRLSLIKKVLVRRGRVIMFGIAQCSWSCQIVPKSFWQNLYTMKSMDDIWDYLVGMLQVQEHGHASLLSFYQLKCDFFGRQ